MAKRLLPLSLFLLPLFVSAQLLPDVAEPVTRAVIIGISDYENAQVKDLQFADKDAEAFGSFLKSKAGGSLPDAQIRLLTNENANWVNFWSALEWLVDNSKENDLAIIYFSGHGGAERLTQNRLGFLLTYDSPSLKIPQSAFMLETLKSVMETLFERGVKIWLFADACHSGTISGGEETINSTTASLAKPFFNEIKLISCQPNELSWGRPQLGRWQGRLLLLPDRGPDGQSRC
ncbi:MAG: caspase family protein [Saprospirales bacterium]|nr:caspase family protein [Saprospirales bacterium]